MAYPPKTRLLFIRICFPWCWSKNSCNRQWSKTLDIRRLLWS